MEDFVTKWVATACRRFLLKKWTDLWTTPTLAGVNH